MNINDYKYLWDGSEPGWCLQHICHCVWRLVFYFNVDGPDKSTIVELHKLIPELKEESLPAIYKRLKGLNEYRTIKSYGNIEAKRMQSKASALGLLVEMEADQKGGYTPIFEGKRTLIIEDDDLLKSIAEKMIEAGVKVIEIYVD